MPGETEFLSETEFELLDDTDAVGGGFGGDGFQDMTFGEQTKKDDTALDDADKDKKTGEEDKEIRFPFHDGVEDGHRLVLADAGTEEDP